MWDGGVGGKSAEIKEKEKKKKTNTNARRLLVDAKVICCYVRHGPGMSGRMSVKS